MIVAGADILWFDFPLLRNNKTRRVFEEKKIGKEKLKPTEKKHDRWMEEHFFSLKKMFSNFVVLIFRTIFHSMASGWYIVIP